MVLVFLRFLVLVGIGSFLIYFLRRLYRTRSVPKQKAADPYIVLGISRGATDSEIKEAYHQELAKYHPDKVDHLGEDLQRLARAKTTEIINAYQSLIRR